MASYVRSVKLKVATWWSRSKKESTLYANCLAGLNTSGEDNALSVWLADNETLELVIVQLAGARNHCADLGFLLVDEQAIRGLGLTVDRERPDRAVAEILKDRHFNVAVGTGAKLLELSNALMRDSVVRSMTKSEIAGLFKRLSDAGAIDGSQLDQGFIDSVQKKLSRSST